MFSIIIGIVFSFIYIIKEINYHKDVDLPIIGKVVDIKNNEYNNQVTIKNKRHKYIVKTKEQYNIGDILQVSGKIEQYKVHYPNQFDYSKYLHYNNVKYVIVDSSIKKINHQFSIKTIHYRIKEYIVLKFPKEVSSYISTLTIGSSDTLDSTNIDKIGISHLFVISGLHVSIIIMIISKLLKILKINNKIIDYITIIIIGFYVIVTNYLISVIRVFISLILKKITSLNNLDVISCNFIIILLINPYLINLLSFILTYIIAFFMVIYTINIKIHIKYKLLNKIINYLLNTFLLTILIQLLVLPFIITINPDLNLISIIINPLFIIFVTYIYLPMSFITLIIPIILPLYGYITIIFEYLVENTAKIEFLLVSLGNIHTILKVVYYGVFYLLLIGIENKKFKLITIFIVFMCCWYYKGIFKLTDQIYFLDVAEGDATVIVSKFSNNVIVIDTGEITKNNDFTKIIKNMGIKKIDYLIISHSDSDHIGGALNLVKYVKVENLILNYYDKTSSTKYLTSYCKKTYYLKQGNKIKNKYFILNVLSPSKDYQNINDNSLVFTLKIKNTTFLFTGDISSKVEQDIIKHNKIVVDFYKVAHHGSKTSTSNEFLSSIDYKYAVVMSGYYNPFGFPIEFVMNRIPKYKQLRTDQKGTIIVNIKKKGFKIKN